MIFKFKISNNLKTQKKYAAFTFKCFQIIWYFIKIKKGPEFDAFLVQKGEMVPGKCCDTHICRNFIKFYFCFLNINLK